MKVLLHNNDVRKLWIQAGVMWLWWKINEKTTSHDVPRTAEGLLSLNPVWWWKVNGKMTSHDVPWTAEGLISLNPVCFSCRAAFLVNRGKSGGLKTGKEWDFTVPFTHNTCESSGYTYCGVLAEWTSRCCRQGAVWLRKSLLVGIFPTCWWLKHYCDYCCVG